MIAFSSGINAQPGNKQNITGQVHNENNRPADNATVSLLRAKDSAMLKTALPDKEGKFEFENVKPGNYLVSISSVGYKKHFTSIFVLEEDGKTFAIAAIALQPAPSTLAAVTIEAKKPFIERKIDRLIVNVENSIISTGSTALEVLERSPGVMVNQESGINLKGKSGVTIMIDGKVSPLSGADLITYLKSIPSDNIDRVEIITNPSAKYDASGNAGIIDIRFKKDKREGYNGNTGVSLGQGVYNKPAANLTLNYRKKKWNLFTTDAVNAPKGFANFHINRKFFTNGNGPVESIFDQNTFTRQPQQSMNLRVGADYYANKKTVLGVLFNTNFYKGTRDGLSNALITGPDGSLQYKNVTSNLLKDKRYNLLGNFNFKHTFDSTGKEINADLDLGRFRARPRQDIFINTFDANSNPLAARIQKSDQQSTISVSSFKADYTQPLKGNAKFEAGIKTSFVTTDNDVKFFDVVNSNNVPDVNRSNHFVYKENVNAAYLNFSKQFKQAGLQVGLRMEHTNSKGDQLTTSENLNRNYVQLFPSVFLSRKLNDNNEFTLSYSRRIDRPTYRQLNPFKLLVDNYTYVLGDPYLQPVFSNSYQLGYTYRSNYNVTLSYLDSRDAITDVFVQDDVTKISSQTPANMQAYKQYDIAFNIPVAVKKWMNANINASFYYNNYESRLQGGQLQNDYTAWDISITNSFVFGKKGWTAEMNGFYQSKNVWGQFTIRNLAQLSAGVQKVSKNKKSVYKLAAADMFSTNHIAVVVKYQNQDWFTDRTWDSRFVTLSYNYRFGKNTVTKARQRTSGVEDEKRRAG
jgi:outer membrane receptor protein involved in Fe transport